MPEVNQEPEANKAAAAAAAPAEQQEAKANAAVDQGIQSDVGGLPQPSPLPPPTEPPPARLSGMAPSDPSAPNPNPGTEDASASAADPAPEPLEAVDPPHPAIAELQGPGVSLGHVVDITGMDYDLLPCGPCAVDDHGRVWRVRHRRVDVVVEREGDEGPSTHSEGRDELVFVGRLHR